MRDPATHHRIDDHGASALYETDHPEWDGAETKKAAHNDHL